MAFHNYADVHGTLPPAAVCGDDGRPLLSWRVLLLPYLEQQKLYDEFRLDEPWDSPHNRPLLDRMPRTYQAPWTRNVDVPPNHTVLKVFVGSGTAFEPPAGRAPAGSAALAGPAACRDRFRGLRLKDNFPDGTSDTLLYAEAGDPVPWTKPDDIPFDPDRPLSLRGLFRGGQCRAGTVDGRGYLSIYPDADWAALRGAITRNGGEPGPRPWELGPR